MEKIVLRLPVAEDEIQVWAYREAVLASDNGTVNGGGGLGECESFSAWLTQNIANRRPETVKPGLVPATTFLAVRESDGVLVGMIDIRHTLNDHLLNYGGHIGYGVHPAHRRRGYATEMLRQALRYCRDELKLDRALVTCDADNAPSRRTILANGGVFEDARDQRGTPVQRYWIML